MKARLLAALLVIVLPSNGYTEQGTELPPVKHALDFRCVHLKTLYSDEELTELFVGIFIGQFSGSLFAHHLAKSVQEESTLPLELIERSSKAFTGNPTEIKHRILAKCARDDQLLLRDALLSMYLEKALEK